MRGAVWAMVGALSLGALPLGACGTPPPEWTVDAGPCIAYAVPTTTDLTTPSVSFNTDVMKVFNDSCGTSLCHGSTDSPTGGVFLGASSAMGQDADTVYAALVGKSSNELQSMNFVTAGDATNSYLMHKLDGDQCMFQESCVGGDCMHSMPSGQTTLLGITLRDTVRRWIVQGAADN